MFESTQEREHSICLNYISTVAKTKQLTRISEHQSCLILSIHAVCRTDCSEISVCVRSRTIVFEEVAGEVQQLLSSFVTSIEFLNMTHQKRQCSWKNLQLDVTGSVFEELKNLSDD